MLKQSKYLKEEKKMMTISKSIDFMQNRNEIFYSSFVNRLKR